jgi:hypothetical protein
MGGSAEATTLQPDKKLCTQLWRLRSLGLVIRTASLAKDGLAKQVTTVWTMLL